MLPDNRFIATQFSLLSKLMDIHGVDSFRSKTYSIAAFNVEKLPVQLSSLPREKIFELKGIGGSIGKKIIEIIDTGALTALEEYLRKTPPGILELLSIKGIGPKKIAVIWKEMEIESPGELLYACTENRLTRFKGFGEKSQQSIQEAVSFYLNNQGSHLFAEVEAYAQQIHQLLLQNFPGERFEHTGAFRRELPVIDKLEWVSSVPVASLQTFFGGLGYTEEEVHQGSASFRTTENILLQFFSRADDVFYHTLFETTGSETFLTAFAAQNPDLPSAFPSEVSIFEAANLPVIPAFLRETAAILEEVPSLDLTRIIQPTDIRGIIHSHSEWSDGAHTIAGMAEACIQQGYEYLVISDHSKSAAYANGLSEERIGAQHRQIDELNERYAPFRIFKSIESDILGDGSLDYSDELLSTFDLVIASIHSNIKMPLEKAMTRLMNAISNPYTTILGHMTARLLLSRPGYPVDHGQLIDACADHGVAIEINANPRRLDMDWQWIPYAMKKGVLLSINPDAHKIKEFDNCRFGVLAARKGGLTTANNLSSFSLKDFENFINARRPQR